MSGRRSNCDSGEPDLCSNGSVLEEPCEPISIDPSPHILLQPTTGKGLLWHEDPPSSPELPKASRSWAIPSSLPGLRKSCSRAHTQPAPAQGTGPRRLPGSWAAREPELPGLLGGVDSHQLDLCVYALLLKDPMQGFLRLEVCRAPVEVLPIFAVQRVPLTTTSPTSSSRLRT
jgi:hypothetical protein